MHSDIDLQIDSVSKSFGETAVLRDVNLCAKSGEFISLVGPSGCGKSTLLRIIAGLEKQDLGSIKINSQAVDGLLPKERNVAMVFQNYALYPHLSVAANISVPLEMARLSWFERLPLMGALSPRKRSISKSIEQEVQAICQSLQLSHLLERKPGQLSGGQRQRVALARAMIRHPSIFLMDEPLSNLDAKLRTHLRNELVELHRKLGVTFIYVTHDQSEAMTMSDRIAVMDSGEILQIGTPSELYQRPHSLKIAKFIGSPQINTIHLKPQSDGVLSQACSNLMQGARAEFTFCLRPEHLSLDSDQIATCDVRFQVPVIRSENHGSEIWLFAHLNESDDAQLTIRIQNQTATSIPDVGDVATVGFKWRDALFFDAHGFQSSAPWA